MLIIAPYVERELKLPVSKLTALIARSLPTWERELKLSYTPIIGKRLYRSLHGSVN